MQFLISVIDDLTASATPAEMEAIDIFNDKLRMNGHWIFAGGLSAPHTVTVIDNRNGANQATGQSLFAAQENFSGCWIVEARDIEEARVLAYEGSQCCNRKVELRRFLG